MKTPFLLCCLLFGSVASVCQLASVQVNQQNKTISIVAEYTAKVDPEIALLHLGYHNMNAQKDAAYAENLQVSEKIQKALAEFHIPDSAIETETLRLDTVTPDDEEKPRDKHSTMYVANQVWRVRVSAAQAQAVVDAAVRAGANDITAPDWSVADPVGLEARASGEALAKARRVAEQMAKGLGAQLGDLVFASNTRQTSLPYFGGVLNTSSASIGRRGEQAPVLKIFRKQVELTATVTAVFAIK